MLIVKNKNKFHFFSCTVIYYNDTSSGSRPTCHYPGRHPFNPLETGIVMVDSIQQSFIINPSTNINNEEMALQDF